MTNHKQSRGRVFFLVFVLFGACQPKDRHVQSTPVADWNDHWEHPLERDSILAMEWVHPRIKEYLNDPAVVILTGTFLSDTSQFAGVRNLGDINSDHINDSIMVVPELFITADSSYENGASIIFSDPSIPRIKVDQTCLDLNYVFVTADVDEDGYRELGKYYTTCVSRFKVLDLLSLKNNQWTSYGTVTYDTWFENPPKEERIRKLEKGLFEMREVTDSSDVKIDRWIRFHLK